MVTAHSLPVEGEFRISHGTVDHVDVVRVQITENGFTGRGECRPYARYGETVGSVKALIETIRPLLETDLDIAGLQSILPAGAARNAVDCALWDLRAKSEQLAVSRLLDTPAPRPRKTAFTLSIDTPENVAKAARAASSFDFLKIKISSADGIKACQAAIDARPDTKLIIDANEALTLKELQELAANLPLKNIALVEQPLPATEVKPGIFYEFSPLKICADESLHTSGDLGKIADAGYTAVNIKLDKSGGLTEAHRLCEAAHACQMTIMAGCMVGSSLAIAPMIYLEFYAEIIDLDGPILLAKDIEDGLKYEGQILHPPETRLWG